MGSNILACDSYCNRGFNDISSSSHLWYLAKTKYQTPKTTSIPRYQIETYIFPIKSLLGLYRGLAFLAFYLEVAPHSRSLALFSRKTS